MLAARNQGREGRAAFAGAFVGWLAGSVLRIRRAHVERALARARVEEPRAVASRMYRRLGIALVELLAGRGAMASGLDVARLDEALAEGPVVLLASHCGNWELAAAAAARHLAGQGRALHVVAKPMRSAFFDRWLGRLRTRLGIRVIPPAGALAAAHEALLRGDVVAMPIDQVPDREGHGTWVDFLGAPALVDRAPATVAYRAGATALVVAEGRVLEAIPPPPRGAGRGGGSRTPASAWVDAATRAATAALERHIQADPASWMWLHRRWKRPAPRPARRAWLVAPARVD